MTGFSDLGDRSSAFTAESIPLAYERYFAAPLFEPWAEVLLDTVGLASGAEVLDVASGTGVLARAAARRAGRAGRVVASDVSAAMLARSAAAVMAGDAAAIAFEEASADALPFMESSFDVVLCQQGLQFFPDQQRAVDEMRRVVRRGGLIGIAVWARGHPLVPFEVYSEELVGVGAEPPFPSAFESSTFAMTIESVRGLLGAAKFTSVDADVVELEVSWPDAATAAAGVFGTPFAPVLRALPPEQRERYDAATLARFAPDRPGEPVRRRTAAVIARGVAS